MQYQIPVWQMIRDALQALGSEVVSTADIRSHVQAKYGDVNPGTVGAQINSCCVNNQKRVNYPENQRPRRATKPVDFLYKAARDQFTLYNPEKHGQWEIAVVDGKCVVRKLNGGEALQAPEKQQLQKMRQQHKKHSGRDIERPSAAAVRRYLQSWDGLGHYTYQEEAVKKLFSVTYPANTEISEVLVKVAALNTFYSTNIRDVYAVARHIVDLNIDARLACGDETLVNEIARVTTQRGQMRNEFSFATKYCSCHNNRAYPIYDSFVAKVLLHFRDADSFAEFMESQLRDFPRFKRVIEAFQAFYGLEAFTAKEIDMYLWQFGKDSFS